MELNRKQLKSEARDSLRGRKPNAYLVTLVYVLIVAVLGALAFRLEYPGLDIEELSAVDSPAAAAALYERAAEPGLLGRLLYYAVEIMETVVGFGFVSFCLLVSRGEAAGYGNLFDGFGVFFRALWLAILRSLLILLWSLPAAVGGGMLVVFAWGMLAELYLPALLVPAIALVILGCVLAIVASYRYSMAFFILLDAPDKPATQCLRESRELTAGRKGKLFVLDLSFLGWILLSVVPFVGLYTLPYMQVTWANYYRALSGWYEAPKHIDVSI